MGSYTTHMVDSVCQDIMQAILFYLLDDFVSRLVDMLTGFWDLLDGTKNEGLSLLSSFCA